MVKLLLQVIKYQLQLGSTLWQPGGATGTSPSLKGIHAGGSQAAKSEPAESGEKLLCALLAFLRGPGVTSGGHP